MIYLFLNFLGTGELIFTVLIFILLFGADKIPSFSRNIGMFINKLKDASEDIKREINNSNLDIKSDIDEEIDQILKSKKKKKKNINKLILSVNNFFFKKIKKKNYRLLLQQKHSK